MGRDRADRARYGCDDATHYRVGRRAQEPRRKQPNQHRRLFPGPSTKTPLRQMNPRKDFGPGGRRQLDATQHRSVGRRNGRRPIGGTSGRRCYLMRRGSFLSRRYPYVPLQCCLFRLFQTRRASVDVGLWTISQPLFITSIDTKHQLESYIRARSPPNKPDQFQTRFESFELV
jgi:hypothetical protein